MFNILKISGEFYESFKKIVNDIAYNLYILGTQQAKLNELNNELSCYNRDLQEEKLETEKLTDTLATLSDDKYMEEVARDKLGLVMPTEIIFMDASI